MRDEWFIRGEVPMTKSEARAVSLSKLELRKDSVLWDVGAGTGSVSIEAALCHPVRKVCAFEKQEKGIRLIMANREKAGISGDKLEIIPGWAPASFPDMDSLSGQSVHPTHAFLGGSCGCADAIIGRLIAINPCIRIVMNVIALETLASAVEILKRREIQAEIVMLQVSGARRIGAYQLMQGGNPVYIITFGGEESR